MEKYYDKHGKEIKDGMLIRHDDGDVERVYGSEDNDLGVNASNEDWLNRHGGNRELYPLYQFDLNEWEIIEEETNNG